LNPRNWTAGTPENWKNEQAGNWRNVGRPENCMTKNQKTGNLEDKTRSL
jgi:hypothetical protein